MQLDSKESDIEQLREKLNDLQLRMDNSSVTSLQTDETDSNLAGRVTTGPNWTLLLLMLYLAEETQAPMWDSSLTIKSGKKGLESKQTVMMFLWVLKKLFFVYRFPDMLHLCGHWPESNRGLLVFNIQL